MSPSCEQITGYRVEDFISNYELLTSIVHPDDIEAVHKHNENIHNTKNRNKLDEIKFRIIKKDH